MGEKRARKWIISWNNYPKDLTLEKLKEKLINHAKVNYLVLGYEKGEKEETPHIQGYVNFNNPQYFTPVRKLLDNGDETYGYIEQAYGNDLENKEYCTKQNNYIEYGKPNENNDNKYQELIEDIINKIPFTILCKKYSEYVCKNYNNFKALYNDLRKYIRDKELEIYNINKGIELIQNENGEIKYE